MELAHPFDYRKLATSELAPDPPCLDTRLQWSPTVTQQRHAGPQDARKEKSRDAARSRRGKENHEFYELARLLPLPGAITSQLDKASIVRLTLSFLRIGQFSRRGDPPWDSEVSQGTLQRGPHIRLRGVPTTIADAYDRHQGTHILQSLDGFAFTLGADGRFLYISETVSIYLGLSQVEMCGSSIFDYIHAEDHAEFAEAAGLTLSNGRPLASPGEESSGPVGTHNPDVNVAMTEETTSGFRGLERGICVRMKSTLTKRGCYFRTPGYRALQLQCRLRPAAGDRVCPSSAGSPGQPGGLLGLVAVAVALPPPSVHELRLDGHTFVTRVTFDFHIVHCESRVPDQLDFTPERLTGQNLYTLCHGADVCHLRQAHLDLLTKGQVLTSYYRLLNQNGGYTWLQTCATVVCNSKSDQEQMIVCVNYVLTRPEFEGVIMESCLLGGGVCLKTDGATEHHRHHAGVAADSHPVSLTASRASDSPSHHRIPSAVKLEAEMALSCDTVDATNYTTQAEPPRGQKRSYDCVIRSPGGSTDSLSVNHCGAGRRCCDSPGWRRRRRRDSGPSAALSPALNPATVRGQQLWAGQPAAIGRRSVIRSGGLSADQTELAPTPPSGDDTTDTMLSRAPLPGPAGFTPPASVSPQEPPPLCGSPPGPGPLPLCGSPPGPGPLPLCGSPLGPGPPPPCGSPLGLDPPTGNPQGLHLLQLGERAAGEAFRPFWYAPHSS